MGRSVKLQEESFNPEDAQYYLAKHNYIGQRKISKIHVNTLSYLMEIGDFRECTEIGLCHMPNGDKWLVNGQHCLSAVVKSGKPQIFGVHNYQCRDMDEVATIYSTYDRQRARGPADAYAAHGLHTELGLKPTQLCHFTGGINSILNAVHIPPDRKCTPGETMAYARSMVWRFRKYLEAAGSGPASSGKQRASVVALSLITAEHPSHFDFWNGYATDDGLRKFDPRKVFLSLNVNSSVSSSSNNSRPTLSELVLFKIGIYCWNKFLEGKPLHQFKIDHATAVTGIKGTTFSTGWTEKEFYKMLEVKR